MMFRALLEKWLETSAIDAFNSGEFDAQISNIINEKIRELKPETQLTFAGFLNVFAVFLCDIWPDLDNNTAQIWCAEYLKMADVRFGSESYFWTACAARDLAKQYVDEYGE